MKRALLRTGILPIHGSNVEEGINSYKRPETQYGFYVMYRNSV